MEKLKIRPFRPNDVPWLVERHGVHYSRDEGFDETFAPLVASILDEFTANHDPEFERGWIAEMSNQRVGSIFSVRLTPDIVKLRLFFLVPEARGQGLGKKLIETAWGLRGTQDFGKWCFGRMRATKRPAPFTEHLDGS